MKRLLPLLALTIGACSLERGSAGVEPQRFDDAGAPDAGGFASDSGLGGGPGAGTLAGTWLAVHEASSCVLIEEQVTWASYIVEIEEDARVLTERRTQCEIALSPVLGLQVTIPDAVIESIEMIEVDKGFVSSFGTGGAYSSATELSLWGLDLDEPLAGEVPDDPADRAVVDSDGDGNPGVTFAAGRTCERWVAQRTIVRYEGTLTAPNQIDGSSVTVTDSNVIGSSQPLCGVAPRIRPNDAFSRFRMVRVDGAGGAPDLDTDGDGRVTCAETSSAVALVLERREPDRANCPTD